jgi:hypothetical protein
MDTFSMYMKDSFANGDDFFKAWDFKKIEKDYATWRVPSRWLSVYVLANDCLYFATHTHIGCTEDVMRRLNQHNGLIAGGPSETKRAVGHWKLMFYILIPPIRNYSSKDIKKQCKTGRGWASRCIKTLEIALQRGLQFRICKDVFDSESKYYTKEIVKIIEDYCSQSMVDLDTLLIDQNSLAATAQKSNGNTSGKNKRRRTTKTTTPIGRRRKPRVSVEDDTGAS